jgi:cell division protease FtsH
VSRTRRYDARAVSPARWISQVDHSSQDGAGGVEVAGRNPGAHERSELGEHVLGDGLEAEAAVGEEDPERTAVDRVALADDEALRWARRRAGGMLRTMRWLRERLQASRTRRRAIVQLTIAALALLAFNWWTASRVTREAPRVRVPYSPFFLRQIEAGNVEAITSRGTAIQGRFVRPVRYPPGDDGARTTGRFRTEIPAFADENALSRLLQQKAVVINAEPLDRNIPWWESLLLGFGPTILLIGLLLLLLRKGGTTGALGRFGRSRARLYDPSGGRLTFADVAGIDDAKLELAEVVDFLRDPKKYASLGARIPRGVLLSGPPGTGKTLLARAVAGEADVPFFSMSASEFVEAIVGVGASRVRDLFGQAKKAAPAIVFVDELDAVGRARTAGGGGLGGSDEREQTLNQILTEMDGFDASTGVIVIASTNRPDVLDAALLRPGRFDRRVAVQPPDRAGRRAILEVHAREVPLAADVDLERLASTTPGMVGADLANLVNEAALLGARRNNEAVTADDFADALEKILLGAERKIVIAEADRRRTAYHEAGHALVGMLTPGADPVRKVSIIPRGIALGVTVAAPDADRFNYDEQFLLARIRVGLGGRIAEELAFGDVTAGAESDIQQLTQIARLMVGRWGMSPLVGPIAVLPADGNGSLYPGAAETSEATQRLVDEEVRRIVTEASDDVAALLTEHRDRLDALADALLAGETLDEEAAYAAAGIDRPPAAGPVPSPA